MGIDSHIAWPQFSASHVLEAVVQQQPANARAMPVCAYQAEHQRAQVIKRGQFVAAESNQLITVDNDEQGTVRLIQA